jgi:hypothetical protein
MVNKKLKLLSIVSFSAQIIGTVGVYFAVYKVFPILGVTVFLSHVIVELSDYYSHKEMINVMKKEKSNNYQDIIQQLGGGNA